MAMLQYKHFDWKKSPAHISLLGRFRKPRSIRRETQMLHIHPELKEDVDHAIQRFVDEQVLIKPTLAEVISALHTKARVEEALREHNLKTTGDKSQLIARLIKNAPEAARSMVEEHDMLICSGDALVFLDKYEKERQAAEKMAKERAFAALLDGNATQAYSICIEYQRTYGQAETYSYHAEGMEVVLKNEPELLRHLNERDKKYLRAATCMPMLWYRETPGKWLPRDFSTTFPNGEVAASLLATYAQIQQRIGDADKDQKFKILFNTYDVDSCALCRRLDGKILARSEIPELPDVNCSSKKGCQCDIRHHWEGGVNFETDSKTDVIFEAAIDFRDLLDLKGLEEFISEKVEEYLKENVDLRLDPWAQLQTAKKMLDEGLITADDYEVAKHRILSKL